MPEKRTIGDVNARYNELSQKVLRSEKVTLTEFQEVGRFILDNHSNRAYARERYRTAVDNYNSGNIIEAMDQLSSLIHETNQLRKYNEAIDVPHRSNKPGILRILNVFRKKE